MMYHGLKHQIALRAVGCVLIGAVLSMASVQAALIVDDSWADGGRNNGADALDSNWWASSSSSGIEVSVGSLGLVTGGSGRGIHTVFPTQTLDDIGDCLKATYTFTTPATVRPGSGVFKVGLFDTLGRAGLDADITASSSSPNDLYGNSANDVPGLPGFMVDMDVNDGVNNLNFRKSNVVLASGRLLGTTSGFDLISPNGPDSDYSFAPNTQYTGSLTVTRLSATEMELSATIGTTSYSLTSDFDSADFGLLAFWVNSSVFGASSTPGEANNGIDFSNVQVEFCEVPEASSICLALLGVIGALARRTTRRR